MTLAKSKGEAKKKTYGSLFNEWGVNIRDNGHRNIGYTNFTKSFYVIV